MVHVALPVSSKWSMKRNLLNLSVLLCASGHALYSNYTIVVKAYIFIVYLWFVILHPIKQFFLFVFLSTHLR